MRISVSDLDQYRYYRASEEMRLEELLARLNKETPPSPAMLAGRALHKLLENATEDDGERITLSDGAFSFFFECDVEMALPQIRELKGEVVIDTSVGPVVLVGIVDGMDHAVYDYKLTGQFDALRFAESFQWRCYLMMFGGRRFDYRVFVGRENLKTSGFDGRQVNSWTIHEYHELSLYRYPELERDVHREVEEFALFLSQYQHLLKRAA